MSVLFTGTNQGYFTSTGAAQILQIPSGLDYIWVKNWTQYGASGAGQGVEFYWQLGMPQGRGLIQTKTSSTNALVPAQLAATKGFYLINSTINIPSTSEAITTIDGDGGAYGGPLVNTGNTLGLPVTAVVGADNPAGVVRLFNITGGTQYNALDFSVANVVLNTSFDLIFMSPQADATTGTYRIIPFDPYYYPTYRYISDICVATAGTAGTGNPALQSNQAIVTLTVTHGYTVGQEIRFLIPTVNATAFGMTQLNQVQATIIAVGDLDANGIPNTIRVNVDVSGFTAFAFPVTGDPAFTPAMVIPFGENTAQALQSNVNILGDATVNTAYFGIQLQAGAGSPAGVSGDLIYWVAGKSFNT